MYPIVFAQSSQMKSICPLSLLNSQYFGMTILNTPGTASFRPTSVVLPHALEQWTGSEYVAPSFIFKVSYRKYIFLQKSILALLNFGLD